MPPTRADPAPLPTARKLLYAAIAVAAILGAAEGGFRVAGFGRRLLVAKEPGLGWRLLPDQDCETGNGLPIHVDALGFRDEEFPLVKPPGEWRVLVVGDSLTFGIDVGQESPFPRRMHKTLARTYGPGRVRVVNGGVPGYDVDQYRLFLERHGFALDPDVVLLAFFPNDIDVAPRPSPYADFPGRDLLRRTALFQGLDHLFTRVLVRPTDTSAAERDELERLLDVYVGREALDPDLSEWRLKMRLAREVLARMDEDCRAHGARLAVLFLPAFVHTEGREPNKIAEKLAARLAEPGVPTRDLLAPLARRHPDVWLAHDPGHLSDLGHRIVAEEAVSFLREAGLLPDPQSRPARGKTTGDR